MIKDFKQLYQMIKHLQTQNDEATWGPMLRI